MKKIVNFNGSEIELDFKNGFAIVEMGRMCNFINPKGELLSNQWFYECRNFTEAGVACVSLGDKKKNLINKEGKLIFKGIAINCIDMYDDERYHTMWTERGMTYIKPNGEFAFGDNMWFETGNRFIERYKYVSVRKDGKWNFIDASGKLLFKNWYFEKADEFFGGFAKVRLYGKENYINEHGELLCKNTWFDYVENYFRGEYAFVQLYGNNYLIDRVGNLYVGEWYNEDTIKRTQWPKEPTYPSALV